MITKNGLVPEDLSESPIVIELGDLEYDHRSQCSITTDPRSYLELQQRTFNRTQTFNSQGRPSDSDHD